jgi:hypothetical protein
MKIKKEIIEKILFPFLYNDQLMKKLEEKWWHRLLIAIYYLIFVFFIILVLVGPSKIYVYNNDFDILTYLANASFIAAGLYLIQLIIQFSYYNIFLYIIYNEKSNLFYNIKKILKILLKLIIVLLIFNGIIIFIAKISCNRNLNFNYYPTMYCECEAGYRETNYGCFKPDVPENAHECINKFGWCCNTGYIITFVGDSPNCRIKNR